MEGTSRVQFLLMETSPLQFLLKEGTSRVQRTSAEEQNEQQQFYGMESRKWEDMDKDCLVNIFGRVGILSLALDVPSVCKSWYKATRNPLCWRYLVFPSEHQFFDRRFRQLCNWSLIPDGDGNTFSVVKGAVHRSKRSAIELVLPNDCTNDDIIYALEECPLLKLLLLPYSFIDDQGSSIIPSMINKLKNLEVLMLQFSQDLEEIIAQISIHCENFVTLSVTNAEVYSDASIAIATLLPNIKYLFLRGCVLEKSNLVIILNGCKNLEYLDVTNCTGFKSDDEEILNIASHITTFKCEGSCLSDDYDDYDHEISGRDVYFHFGSD